MLFRSLPLRRTVAFPLTLQPLAVNRPVSIESVNRALATDRLVLLVLQDNEEDDPKPEDLRKVGTVGIIRQMARVGGGINIIIEGVARVRADLITRTGTSMRAQITPMPERVERTTGVATDELRALVALLTGAARVMVLTARGAEQHGFVHELDEVLALLVPRVQPHVPRAGSRRRRDLRDVDVPVVDVVRQDPAVASSRRVVVRRERPGGRSGGGQR